MKNTHSVLTDTVLGHEMVGGLWEMVGSLTAVISKRQYVSGSAWRYWFFACWLSYTPHLRWSVVSYFTGLEWRSDIGFDDEVCFS